MGDRIRSAFRKSFTKPGSLFSRAMRAAERHNAPLLFFLVFGGVVVMAVLVMRDWQAANAEAQQIYTGSVHGLQLIGELQYDAQETRRATLYALTTSDSNLQVEYADQSRAADQRVKSGIVEYGHNVRRTTETDLSVGLALDWANYLEIRDNVLALILEGSTREAVGLDLTRGVPAFERVRQDLNRAKRLYDEDASFRETNLIASSRRSAFRLAAISSFTFLLSVGAVWAIQRSRILSTMQLARLQMEFVASVSHELRTPLAVMSSAADNLADGVVEGKDALRKYGGILQNQSRNMSELVDQILLFASTEDGKRQYTLEPIEVESLVASIVANTAALLKKSGFTLDLDIEPCLPPVLGDFAGVGQCLQNLIGNAIKYSGNCRRIVLEVALEPERGETEDQVKISVSDEGIGIDVSELPRIFEPFYRSPRVQAAQIHGTGLGLSLAKRIAEGMGGRLLVRSQLSVGSTFTLHLPIAKGQAVKRPEITSRPNAAANL